jgi:hypothetical protein
VSNCLDSHAPGQERFGILPRLDCIGLGLVWSIGQVWDESLCLGQSCKATSGMSPCGFGKVVRQPFWLSGFLNPVPLVNELIFGLAI